MTQQSSAIADHHTLLYNANIISISDNNNNNDNVTRYNYVLFNNNTGRIVQLGYNIDEINKLQYNNLTLHNMNGLTVLPGLIDSHIHVQHVGKHNVSLDLNLSGSIQELQNRLNNHISKYGNTNINNNNNNNNNTVGNNNEWIVGYNWEQDRLGRFPTRYDIDSICSDRPVILWRICHHIAVCNTKALQLACIDSSTQHTGGIIDKDENGNLTGIVRERSAEIISDLIIETDQQRKAYLINGLNECLKYGITTVQTNDSYAWHLYKQLYDSNQLPIRVFLTIMYDELVDINNNNIPKPNEWHYNNKQSNDFMLNCHRVKLFGDGSLGANTAALSMDYVNILQNKCKQIHNHSDINDQDHNHNNNHNNNNNNHTDDNSVSKGLLIHAQDELNSKVRNAYDKGYRIELHVIGDAAADSGLRAFETAGLQPNDRPIMTHCQVLRHDIIQRMQHINAIANVQPQFSVTDSRWIFDKLHSSLWQYSYCWLTLLNNNIHVSGSSDAPIEISNPLLGMYSSIYRPYENYNAINNARQGGVIQSKHNDVDNQGRWTNSECLTPLQSLQMYTLEGAYTAGCEQWLGQIKVNYVADFTIVDFDPLIEPDKLLNAKIQQVWVHGNRRK